MDEKQELQNFRESIAAHSKVTPGKWDKAIAEIEEFLKTNTEWLSPIKLSPAIVVTDPRKFILAELEVVRANNGAESYQPYLNRILTALEHTKKWQSER